ncbi:hypothetical protein PGT21_008059 [Puccinia graminis f. sp. tritici]|uniref:Uncharacterized protein n=1 Tax=Puccinia graminis f. sp. tritici TaxID=56615 RepID=A0A5B0Q2C5_PUCGR|nr:hypothetical protein PGT21_008059 [Puccinia graminis f. sp. tritici]KAA1124932.1 hypothetical protein PGTUg99_036885 [Puccinia graminis f. sp. tritici]
MNRPAEEQGPEPARRLDIANEHTGRNPGHSKAAAKNPGTNGDHPEFGARHNLVAEVAEIQWRTSRRDLEHFLDLAQS